MASFQKQIKLHAPYPVFCETSIIAADIDKNVELITFLISVSCLPCGLDSFILTIDCKFTLRGVLYYGSQPPKKLLPGLFYTCLATFVSRDENLTSLPSPST
jgi:hypothetical protein